MATSSLINTLKRGRKLAGIALAAHQVRKARGEDQVIARAALANLLAKARGVPMKIGQFLAAGSDGQAFEPLVNGIEPRPLAQMLPALEQQLGQPVDQVFSDIQESKAAASLGQVHQAILKKSNQTVAVKLRYPDIASAVASEMKLVGLMPGMGPAKKWGFDVHAYKQALKNNMDRELDYLDEAQRQMQFYQKVVVPGLVIPQVHMDLCRPGVLVQSWQQGIRLDDVASTWPHPAKKQLACTLMRSFFTALFQAGLVHGDPHPGNYLFGQDKQAKPVVAMLDFGCTLELSDMQRLALLKLIIGCREADQTDPLLCFTAMGFDADKLFSIADTLPALCQVLFEPFLKDEDYSTRYWELGSRTDALLGELRWWLRSAGPANLMFLMRAFHGMIHQLTTLKVIVPWWQILQESVSPQTLDAARHLDLSQFQKTASTDQQRHVKHFNALAQYLKIRITEDGKQVVAVSMPAGQVAHLREQIPDDVLAKIEDAGIDIHSIVRQACDDGIVPSELFCVEVGQRTYRVWLQ